MLSRYFHPVATLTHTNWQLSFIIAVLDVAISSENGEGTRFKKVPETSQARKAIFS